MRVCACVRVCLCSLHSHCAFARAFVCHSCLCLVALRYLFSHFDAIVAQVWFSYSSALALIVAPKQVRSCFGYHCYLNMVAERSVPTPSRLRVSALCETNVNRFLSIRSDGPKAIGNHSKIKEASDYNPNAMEIKLLIQGGGEGEASGGEDQGPPPGIDGAVGTAQPSAASSDKKRKQDAIRLKNPHAERKRALKKAETLRRKEAEARE